MESNRNPNLHHLKLKSQLTGLIVAKELSKRQSPREPRDEQDIHDHWTLGDSLLGHCFCLLDGKLGKRCIHGDWRGWNTCQRFAKQDGEQLIQLEPQPGKNQRHQLETWIAFLTPGFSTKLALSTACTMEVNLQV